MTNTSASSSEKTVLGHPVGLYYLFATEFWERFSYYGMRSLLVLYIIDQFFQTSDGDARKGIAYGIYGAYGALVYATPVIGGVIADKFLGYRKAVIAGATLMALGHFMMAMPGVYSFYIALGLLIVGNGFFKPNISALVGSLYPEGDQRREGGFTIFYMGINLGAFFSPLLCGWLGKVYGWHFGFGLAGFGMLAGLIMFSYASKTGKLGDNGFQPEEFVTKKIAGFNIEYIIYSLTLLTIPLFALLVNQNELEIGGWGLMTTIISLIGLVVLSKILFHMYEENKVESQRLLVLIVFTFISMVFWSFFEQAGTSLTIFADENVILPSWCNAAQSQSINPLVIMIFAVPFAMMWPKLAEKNLNPNSVIKTFIGLLLLGLGFLVFAYSARFMNVDGKVPFFYLVAGYFILTIGELSLSPTILSKTTELAPAKIVSFMLGATLLSSSFAHHIGGIIAKLTVPSSNAVAEPNFLTKIAASITGFNNTEIDTANNGIQSLSSSTMVFAQIGIVAIIVSIVLLIISPLIKKLMHGVH